MTKIQLKKSLRRIQKFEQLLMRELTEEEINFLLEKGDEEFLYNCLEITEDELETMNTIRKLIAAYWTDEEEFDKLLEGDTDSAYLVLRLICDELEAHDEKLRKEYEEEESAGKDQTLANQFLEILNPRKRSVPEEKPIDLLGFYISELKEGKTLELADDMIDKICDKLFETENKVDIKVINNKISAKF